jgi:hypothetical protein
MCFIQSLRDNPHKPVTRNASSRNCLLYFDGNSWKNASLDNQMDYHQQLKNLKIIPPSWREGGMAKCIGSTQRGRSRNIS